MRVTKSELQHKINYLNSLTNKAWFLSQAYGGYSVVRVVTTGGGESDLFRGLGHMPAKDLSVRLNAYMQGIEDAREALCS